MQTEQRVLIVGAGKRVQNALLPALSIMGHNFGKIDILRQRDCPVSFQGVTINTLTSLDELAPHYDVVLNCAAATRIIRLTSVLRARFPNSILMADTPSSASLVELIYCWLSTRPGNAILSLEDWPYLPNLLALKKELPKFKILVIGHIGIVNHFLSVWRQWRKCEKQIDSLGYHGQLKRGPITIGFVAPKDVLKAHCEIISATAKLTDNFKLSRGSNSSKNNELFRTYHNGRLKYQLAEKTISSFDVSAEILKLFEPLDNRRNVHELDKVLALAFLLKLAFNREISQLYCYRDSLMDCIWARAYQRAGWGRRIFKVARQI